MCDITETTDLQEAVIYKVVHKMRDGCSARSTTTGAWSWSG